MPPDFEGVPPDSPVQQQQDRLDAFLHTEGFPDKGRKAEAWAPRI